MKKKWWIITVSVIVVLGWLIAGTFGERQSKEDKELTDLLSLPANNHVLQSQDADINNDTKTETVVLYGKKKSGDGILADNINVAVIEPDTGFVKKTNLNTLKGFEPVMSTCDFTGDKSKEVLITVLTGDKNGGTVNAVIDFSGSIPQNILPENLADGLKMDVKLVDQFSIDAAPLGGEHFAISIAKHKDELVQKGIYSTDGKLLDTQKQISFLPFSLVQVVDDNGDGIYELLGHQKIVLTADQSELCTVISNHAYENGKWVLKKMEYSHTVKKF